MPPWLGTWPKTSNGLYQLSPQLGVLVGAPWGCGQYLTKSTWGMKDLFGLLVQGTQSTVVGKAWYWWLVCDSGSLLPGSSVIIKCCPQMLKSGWGCPPASTTHVLEFQVHVSPHPAASNVHFLPLQSILSSESWASHLTWGLSILWNPKSTSQNLQVKMNNEYFHVVSSLAWTI